MRSIASLGSTVCRGPVHRPRGMGERGTEVPVAGKTLRCCSTVGNRRVRTRTHGGVTGTAREGVPMSIYTRLRIAKYKDLLTL